MKVTYYPGCSLEGTARDYADSIEGVCESFGIELQEIPDWNCCGSTAAHSINHTASIDLPGRNLKLAGQLNNADLLVPCPLCFNRLKAAAHELQEGNGHGFQTKLPPDLPKIWDLANFFATGEMLQKLSSGLKKPLEGLKLVSYYGCMSSRPPKVTGADDFENPQSLDKIVKALGGQPIDWPYKTDCCGASLMISRTDMGFKMVGKILEMARRVGAQGVVVSCQMCQSNLDMYQERIEAETGKFFGLPIMYFTELIGLACGLPGAPNWLSRHFVDPIPLLRKNRLI
ncbi:MAG: CoB--CoM heterodisulfide reductase iron-sulfur subunit B family protein [Desulfobacteraceae bacterium]|nr:CoB--CoM heterodisulfide reductase iron-sulfur subunit B family protein [Desulfobacteraceae bacterium]